MTPSNPTNQQPFIYRVADAAGVFHLVAPVDHTHLTTEVSGLTEALAAKANAAAVETALAGKMDNKTIDSAPTANSTNLVTSGGVKAAIDAATNVIETNDVAYDASELEQGIVYTFLFHNETGEIVALEELIDSNALPNPESFIFFNVDGMHTEIGNGDTAALRVIRTSRGIFVHYDGTFDY